MIAVYLEVCVREIENCSVRNYYYGMYNENYVLMEGENEACGSPDLDGTLGIVFYYPRDWAFIQEILRV